MSELARRAVACKGWRWVPGMLTQHGSRYVAEGRCPRRSVLPDLTDPATLGCLLALVREAWGCRTAYFTHSHGSWLVMRRDPWSLPLCELQDTEARALVAALEAAP